VARRGGFFSRLFGGGWPDPDQVVGIVRARSSGEKPEPIERTSLN